MTTVFIIPTTIFLAYMAICGSFTPAWFNVLVRLFCICMVGLGLYIIFTGKMLG